MAYEVSVVVVAPVALASRRRRVAWGELPRAIRQTFDEVYAGLDAAGIEDRGKNVCVYRNADPDGIELEAGVEMNAAFAGTTDLTRSATPTGPAARTVHVGDYGTLGLATDAIFEWCRSHALAWAGIGWEVYGHWFDDPSLVITEVFELLTPAG